MSNEPHRCSDPPSVRSAATETLSRTGPGQGCAAGQTPPSAVSAHGHPTVLTLGTLLPGLPGRPATGRLWGALSPASLTSEPAACTARTRGSSNLLQRAWAPAVRPRPGAVVGKRTASLLPGTLPVEEGGGGGGRVLWGDERA